MGRLLYSLATSMYIFLPLLIHSRPYSDIAPPVDLKSTNTLMVSSTAYVYVMYTHAVIFILGTHSMQNCANVYTHKAAAEILLFNLCEVEKSGMRTHNCRLMEGIASYISCCTSPRLLSRRCSYCAIMSAVVWVYQHLSDQRNCMFEVVARCVYFHWTIVSTV